jgi:hypothetical protein
MKINIPSEYQVKRLIEKETRALWTAISNLSDKVGKLQTKFQEVLIYGRN